MADERKEAPRGSFFPNWSVLKQSLVVGLTEGIANINGAAKNVVTGTLTLPHTIADGYHEIWKLAGGKSLYEGTLRDRGAATLNNLGSKADTAYYGAFGLKAPQDIPLEGAQKHLNTGFTFGLGLAVPLSGTAGTLNRTTIATQTPRAATATNVAAAEAEAINFGGLGSAQRAAPLTRTTAEGVVLRPQGRAAAAAKAEMAGSTKQPPVTATPAPPTPAPAAPAPAPATLAAEAAPAARTATATARTANTADDAAAAKNTGPIDYKAPPVGETAGMRVEKSFDGRFAGGAGSGNASTASASARTSGSQTGGATPAGGTANGAGGTAGGTSRAAGTSGGTTAPGGIHVGGTATQNANSGASFLSQAGDITLTGLKGAWNVASFPFRSKWHFAGTTAGFLGLNSSYVFDGALSDLAIDGVQAAYGAVTGPSNFLPQPVADALATAGNVTLDALSSGATNTGKSILWAGGESFIDGMPPGVTSFFPAFAQDAWKSAKAVVKGSKSRDPGAVTLDDDKRQAFVEDGFTAVVMDNPSADVSQVDKTKLEEGHGPAPTGPGVGGRLVEARSKAGEAFEAAADKVEDFFSLKSIWGFLSMVCTVLGELLNNEGMKAKGMHFAALAAGADTKNLARQGPEDKPAQVAGLDPDKDTAHQRDDMPAPRPAPRQTFGGWAPAPS